jgi:hypothetical protein
VGRGWAKSNRAASQAKQPAEELKRKGASRLHKLTVLSVQRHGPPEITDPCRPRVRRLVHQRRRDRTFVGRRAPDVAGGSRRVFGLGSRLRRARRAPPAPPHELNNSNSAVRSTSVRPFSLCPAARRSSFLCPPGEACTLSRALLLMPNRTAVHGAIASGSVAS